MSMNINFVVKFPKCECCGRGETVNLKPLQTPTDDSYEIYDEDPNVAMSRYLKWARKHGYKTHAREISTKARDLTNDGGKLVCYVM